MQIVTIDESNIDREHVCCAIGNDKVNVARSATKKAWMRARFKDGLVFRRLDERGKVFIEYMPIEKAWKPVVGRDYLLINCLWVSGKFKGAGWAKKLLDLCVADAREKDMAGVAVVTGSKPFLTDRAFYARHGFVTVDTAPPYFELMALDLRKGAEHPHFSKGAKRARHQDGDGFLLVYSNQCPFMEEYVGTYAATLKAKGLPCKVIELESGEEARRLASPFGPFGMYHDGEFVTHELVTEGRFDELVRKVAAGSRP